MLTPINIAVVGHTNTGKTSLLRTLLHDAHFGDVSNRSATTRNVEAAEILVESETALILFDTPGLEDSSGLLDHLEGLKSETKLDWTDTIHAFLDDDALGLDGGTYAQEAKALRQLLRADLAYYVIDARDQVRGKHRDELEILGRCARPILPVLNFVADRDADQSAWRQQLARANMHAVVAFDTVVVNETSEIELFEKSRTLLDTHSETLTAVCEAVHQRQDRLRQASARLIADMLQEVCSMHASAPEDDEAAKAAAVTKLRDDIRAREQACVDALLTLHRFTPGDYLPEELPLEKGAWRQDLFDSESLLAFGMSTGGAAATGAMAGLAIDLVVGGITLGAAALTGAAIGAAGNVIGSKGRRLLDKVRGNTQFSADALVLELLVMRQLALVRALFRRGHASLNRLQTPLIEEGDKKAAETARKSVMASRGQSDWFSYVSDIAATSTSNKAASNDMVSLLSERLQLTVSTDAGAT